MRPKLTLLLAVASLPLASVSCRRPSDAPAPAASSKAEAAAPLASVTVPGAADASALPPLPEQPPFIDLPVPTFPDAVVSLPNGARSARPVVIAFHAAGEKPNRTCDMWRRLTADRGFILCPRDQDDAAFPGDDMRADASTPSPYARQGGVSLRSFIDVLLDRLGNAYRGYVDGARPIVVGSGRVADEVAQIASDDSRRFPHIALLDGGHDVWSKQRIHAFHWEGGDRVLFGCLSKACVERAKTAARDLEQAGVESEVVRADAARTNDDAMQAAIEDKLKWFLGDDPRWTR